MILKTPMDDFMAVLRSEFEASEGSFLIKLGSRMEWDQTAFDRLTSAMKRCAETTAGNHLMDRWVAEGFWYISWFVKSWATHPQFPKTHSIEHYDKAFTRLDDLASWYFTGECPHRYGSGFEELA